MTLMRSLLYLICCVLWSSCGVAFYFMASLKYMFQDCCEVVCQVKWLGWICASQSDICCFCQENCTSDYQRLPEGLEGHAGVLQRLSSMVISQWVHAWLLSSIHRYSYIVVLLHRLSSQRLSQRHLRRYSPETAFPHFPLNSNSSFGFMASSLLSWRLRCNHVDPIYACLDSIVFACPDTSRSKHRNSSTSRKPRPVIVEWFSTPTMLMNFYFWLLYRNHFYAADIS